MPLDLFFGEVEEKEEPLNFHAEILAMMEPAFTIANNGTSSAAFMARKLLSILYDLEDLHFVEPTAVSAFIAEKKGKVLEIVELIREELSGQTLYGDELARTAGEILPHRTK
jgi:hypothetical protein